MKTITTFTKLIVLVVVFFAASCKEDDPAAIVVVPDPKPDPVPVLAVVGTNDITTFTKTTATFGGKIVSDGGASITEKGICFGTTTAPTIADTKILSGAGNADFTANVTGLLLNTTYYIRAYATNKVGTSYGNEVVLAIGGVDLYLAGGVLSDAGYWKNGIYTALTTKSTAASATAIAVSGNNVYAAGYDGNFLVSWKNGVMTKFTDGTAYQSSAADIVVDGSDVYIGGWEIKNLNSHQVAKYWKNGVEHSLTDGSNDAGVSAMFISGADVYASGYETKNGINVARYWKNGVPVSVTDGAHHAYLSSIFVIGSDVYVGGYERTNDQVLVAKYWKNGVATPLSDGTNHHMVNDISVSNNTVYCTGFDYNLSNNGGDAILWENTVSTALTSNGNGPGYGQARKIYASGSDVYILGSNLDKVLIWKNGALLAPYDGAFGNENYISDMFILDK